jgi:hypothetical protein
MAYQEQQERMRRWLIRWMYGIAVVHLAVGIVLPWIGSLALLETYHRTIEAVFWDHGAPPAARIQQVWWIGLFGPTLQNVALWMGALTHIGDRQRSSLAWGWLIIGVVVWAPQDMLVSLRAGAWIHVWIDCCALVAILPPLFWLWRHDRAPVKAVPQ